MYIEECPFFRDNIGSKGVKMKCLLNRQTNLIIILILLGFVTFTYSSTIQVPPLPYLPNGIRNPERGFRYQVDICKIKGGGYGWDVLKGLDKVPELYVNLLLQKSQISVAQAYCTITETTSILSVAMLSSLEVDLWKAFINGMKFNLRFVYPDNRDPGRDMILSHINQVSPIIRKYEGVVNLFEAGFAGIWGEWHTENVPKTFRDKRDIVEALLNGFPNTMVQVRLPTYKWNMYPDAYDMNGKRKNLLNFDSVLRTINRIGFHNDYFIARQDPNRWDINLVNNPGTDSINLNMILEETSIVPMGGEMPWDFDSAYFSIPRPDGSTGAAVEGFESIKRFVLMRYSTFSVLHNIQNTVIGNWMRTNITLND